MKKLLILLIAITTTGCAGYKNTYACKPSDGVRCKSIATLNQMIDSGKIKTNSSSSRAVSQESFVSGNNLQRSQEKIMQIWLPSYSDSSGIYHSAHHIQAVVKEPTWYEGE